MKYSLYHPSGELIKSKVGLKEVLKSFEEAIYDEVEDRQKTNYLVYNKHFVSKTNPYYNKKITILENFNNIYEDILYDTVLSLLELVENQIDLLNDNEFEDYGLKVRLLPH